MPSVAQYQERLIVALSHRASLCRRIFEAWATVGPTVAVGAKEL